MTCERANVRVTKRGVCDRERRGDVAEPKVLLLCAPMCVVVGSQASDRVRDETSSLKRDD